MAEVITTFDGGTAGADLAAGSNGIQSVPDSPNVPRFVTTIHSIGVRSGEPAGVVDKRFRVDLGVSGNHHGSIYMKYNTHHNSSGNFVTIFNWANSSNSIMATLRVGSGRELNIRVGASTVVRTGSANDVPLNSWFRFDWQVSGTTINWRLHYAPEAAESATPDLSGSFTFSSATISRLILGAYASQLIIKDCTYDTVRANNNGTWYGPYGSGTPSPELGDNLAQPIDLQSGTTQITSSNASATTETGETTASNDGTTPVSAAGHRTMWHRWVAPSTASATITTAGSSFDTYLTVFKAKAGVTDPVTSVTDLDIVVSNDDSGGITSSVTFTPVAGTTYYIQVRGYSHTSGHHGAYTLNYPSPGGGAPSGPTVTVWNGTTEVTGTVTLWNGTTEVPVSVDTIA